MSIYVRVVLSMIIGLRMIVLVRALRAGSPPREPIVYQKTAATYWVQRNRHDDIEAVHVGIAIPDRVRFRLQPETQFDRFAKQLGLATEWQVNDRKFDNKIFVVSDDPIFLRALSNDRVLREHALALMNKFSGATLRCCAGCLWIQAKPGLFGSERDELAANRVLNKGLEHLLAIAERLRAIAATAWDATRDRSVRAELALYIVLEVLAVTAVVLVSFVAIMRKSSRTHLLLFELVVLGSPGVAGLAFAGACWANRHEDAVPVQQVVQVQDRYITKGRRNRKNYHLVVEWPDSRVDSEFGVSEEVYHQYDTARCARVVWGRGYLNDPFLSGMRPVKCDGQ